MDRPPLGSTELAKWSSWSASCWYPACPGVMNCCAAGPVSPDSAVPTTGRLPTPRKADAPKESWLFCGFAVCCARIFRTRSNAVRAAAFVSRSTTVSGLTVAGLAVFWG